MPNKKYIVVGKFGRTHGIKGWLRVTSYTNPIDAIINYKNWYIQQNGQWELIKIDHTMLQGNVVLFHIANVNTPEEAQRYVNQELAILQEQLPPLKNNEYYWADLEGMQVIDKNNYVFGIVDHLFNTGSNDVLVVVGEKRHLIPYLKNVVLQVDLAKKIILVDWDKDF